MKKGVQLPVNVLVIVVVVVIFLLSIVTLFIGGWDPSSKSVTYASAATITCQKVNPAFCNANTNSAIPHENMYAARMPVDNFDANRNGKINDHVPDGNWPTSYLDDNLESLCKNYYGCNVPLLNEVQWSTWYNCCLENVCKCPSR